MGTRVPRIIGVCAALLFVSSALCADTVRVCLRSGQALYAVQREVPSGGAEGALSALVLGPTVQERVLGIHSAIPAGTMIWSISISDKTVAVDFSKDILGSEFGDAEQEAIFEQVRTTLRLNGVDKDVAMSADGILLWQYLPPTPKIEPRRGPEPVYTGPLAAGTSLSGRKITVSPGHGYVWAGSGYGFQRTAYCTWTGLSLEDRHNLEICQYLEKYLLADSATVKMCRCTNKSYGAHASGKQWWEMAACNWLQHLGYPCSVYAGYTGDCTLGSGSSEVNDDIRSRPLSSDYDASDIFFSLHTNALSGDCTGSGCPTGSDIFYDCSTEHSSWCTVSEELEQAVYPALLDAIRNKIPDADWHDHGVHKDTAGNYGEIRIPDRAAVLLELGYHDTCDNDVLHLTDNFFRSAAMWGIYKGMCDYFSATPTWGFYSDELVSNDIPSTMSPGQTSTVHVTFRNRGVLWNSTRGFKMSAVGGSDPFTATLDYAVSTETGPGDTYVFTMSFTAPSTPGSYVTDWRMQRTGYQSFGDTCTQTVSVSGTAPPSISGQPSNQSVCTGGTATFTVTAGGSLPLYYQWRKGTVNITSVGHYSGATTATLTVSTCDSGDTATNYNCYVSNAYGNATSNNAALTVGAALPAAPTAQAASSIGTETITWNWSSVTGAISYRLWTASSGGTQIGGTITNTYYVESGLMPGTSYTRYVETVGSCGVSATRTQLGPTSTTARNCPENGDFEGGFSGSSPTQIPNHWAKLSDDGTSTYTQDTGTKHAGTSSQKIQDPSGGQGYTGYVYQKVNVQPSRQYVLRFYSYRTVGFVVGMGVDVNGGTTFVGAGESSTPGSWVLKETPAPFTSGAGGVITIGYRGGQNGGETVGWIDDITIAPAKPSSTGGTATICSGASTTVTASGGFGGSSSELHWYTGAGGTGTHVGTGTTLGVSPTVTTTYYPRWEASGCTGCCASGDGAAVTITVNPPPSAVTVTDEGSYTPSLNALKASWTQSQSNCGISRYEYAVGTSSTTQNVKGWTSNGTSTSVTISGLSLVEGTTYYVQARAVDNYGNTSDAASANGILAAPGVTPISWAWAKANTTDPFSLRGKIVTAALTGAFWLEETNRTMGIKVVSSASVTRGNTVSVAGVLGTSGTQRALIGDVVINSGGSTTIQPLAVNEKSLGGGNFNLNTPGVTDGAGLYNIGLLVRVCGNVTYPNSDDPSNKNFFLHDGSPRWVGVSYPDPSAAGVLVRCGSVEPPSSGMRMVTGIVASEQSGSSVVPIMIIRDSGDITLP